jgi:histidyl-tRNA synthetase
LKLREYFGELTVIDEVEQLLKYLEVMGISQCFEFDTALARGLDYYTGMIFEGVL